MIREEHVLNEIHAYRYRGEDPRYALVISHGIASHGAIYDIFCCHHADKGVDIWSFDAPGHGTRVPHAAGSSKLERIYKRLIFNTKNMVNVYVTYIK